MSREQDHETYQFTAAAAGGLSDGVVRKSGLDDPGDSLGGLAGSCGWMGWSAAAAVVGLLRSFLSRGGGVVEDSGKAGGGGGGGAKGDLKRGNIEIQA